METLLYNHNKTIAIASVAAILFWGRPVLAAEPSPVGRWKTIDDRTGKPRGVVRIYEENGRLYGKIESSLDPREQRENCVKCPGNRKNQPILGLVILSGMEKSGGGYSGGEILDPDTGGVYQCKLRLMDQGKRLLVRGFIGISLLGRNQTWLRE